MAKEIDSKPDDRLSALKKREQALKAAIAAEQQRQQRRNDRNQSRLVCIIGRAMLEHTEAAPNFKLMLQQVLKTAVIDGRSRKFLADMGWL